MRANRALAEAGANLELADREGRTPLVPARERNYAEMVRTLEAAARRAPAVKNVTRNGA